MTDKQTVRIGVVQWQVRAFESRDAFLAKLSATVAALANAGCDFAVFPEYFSMPLVGLTPELPEVEAVRALGKQAGEFREAFFTMAVEHQINLICGSIPETSAEGWLWNTCWLCRRDGTTAAFRKLHPTPFEQSVWKMTGGSDLGVFDTDCGKIGIQICYDVEFPELGRLYELAGVDILFVPFSTDSEPGYYRVSRCAQARAIENECYVAISGCVGSLPELSAVEYQFARSAVFTPADYAFPPTAVLTEAPAGIETALVTDLNLALLKELREAGTVQNAKDRRKDLY